MIKASHVSTAVLMGALGSAMSFGASAAVAVPLNCQGVVPFATQASAVDSTSTLVGSNWEYEFTVCNRSDRNYGGAAIRDWELPYFGNASGISSISAPLGWDWEIATKGVADQATGWDGVIEWQTDGDPWKAIFDTQYGGAANNPFNFHTEVIHFYFSGNFEQELPLDCGFINPGAYCDGFGITSSVGPGNAPYQASWIELPPRTGDPLFPLQGGAPIPQRNGVPEPGTLALLGLAGLAAAGSARRRKR